MTEPRPTPVLEARGLVKRYGHVTALDGADFQLLAGEILAVIGDNGAGKSTLIKALAGFVYGIAGLLLVARTGVGDPQAGQTDNLDSITAVVLGGTSLFGGRGNILGTLLGALIVGVFRNGLTLMGVASVYQILITGILVILAVTTDQLSRRKG